MSRSVAAAYKYVVHEIETGRLAGGQSVREEIVADQVKVSRTPVREAFRILAAEGWLDARRNHGVRVSTWDLRHVREIFDTRALIEPHLARLAVPHITPQDLDSLTALAESMACAADPSPAALTRRQEANDEFHGLLIRRADQQTLASLLESVRKIPLVKKTFGVYSEHECQRSNTQHFEIIAAIRAGDSELTYAIMKAHILYGKAVALRELCPHAPLAADIPAQGTHAAHAAHPAPFTGKTS